MNAVLRLMFLPLLLTFPALAAAASVDFTSDGAWCWFSDPRAVSRDGKIYAGWMSRDGSVQVGEMEGNRVKITTLAEKFEIDDHNNPALLFLPDGRLAAFYSRHAKGDMHLRITTRPGDISEWTQDRELGFTGTGKQGVTYANPALLADENIGLYVFWRGSDFKSKFAISTDLGLTWSPPRTLIAKPGANQANRPYVKLWTDHKSRIDFAFTDGHPRDEKSNGVYFLRYEKGGFFKADGTRIGSMDDLPLDPAKCDRVYDGSTAGRGWIWDIAENDGRPVIAYTRLPAETDHRYCYARWDGKRWLDFEMTPGGRWFPETEPGKKEREPHYSGGMAMDHRNPGTVYLARPVNDIFEIESWQTPDGGQSWNTTAITRDSKSHNVRPFVVRQASTNDPSRILWMELRGHYTHYTDYLTALRISGGRLNEGE